MKPLFLFFYLLAILQAGAQTSLILKQARPPELEVSQYNQVAVGDIVGPLGAKTEQSLDFTDALTAKLFNAKTLEVIDNNALENIFGKQKYGSLEVLDAQAKAILNKKLREALLITGRIQSRQLEQTLIYQDQPIVVNGCNRKYYYQIKGEVSIQLKILDIKSGKLLFSDAVSKPVDKQTNTSCQVPEKLNLEQVSRLAMRDLGDEVARMIVPFEVSTTLFFSDPGLIKSPFKRLKEAITYLQSSDKASGLEILKAYTESKDIKEKNKDEAWLNYGMALVYTHDYETARSALQKAASLRAANLNIVSALIKIMDEDEQVARKLLAQAEERKKQAARNTPSEQAAQKPSQPASKNSSKSKVKKA